MEGRYNRNMPALSPEECQTLRGKHVCVVGCGGLGGYVIEILARVGVGRLTVVDGDVFDVTNLNRQLLSDETVLGMNKALRAAEHVKQINSDVSVIPIPEFFVEENGERLLEGCDLVVDALDNMCSRHVLSALCTGKNMLIIHGAISGWHAQVTVITPGADVFSKLYPPRSALAPKKGNPPFTPAVCASLQAAEAVKILCGRPSTLIGKLLLLDLQTLDLIKVDI